MLRPHKASTRLLVSYRLHGHECQPVVAVFANEGRSRSSQWQGGSESVASTILGSSSGNSESKPPNAKKIAHSQYMIEYLPHVQRYLFAGGGESGCHYFRIKPDALVDFPARPSAEVFLKRQGINENVVRDYAEPCLPSRRGLQLLGLPVEGQVWQVGMPSDSDAPLNLKIGLNENGVELWLSKIGVGILSVSLDCEPTGSEAADHEFLTALHELNHALATAHKAIWLSSPDGSRRHLHQFLRDVLRPLANQSDTRLICEQRGVVYTALELEQPTDISEFATEVHRELSHLAQVHPVSHPGGAEKHHVNAVSFSSRHHSVVGLAGAAHAVVVPGAGSSEYDRNRLRRVQTVYFSGYLLAQLQRLSLQYYVDNAATISRESDSSEQRRQYESLLKNVAQFGLEGEFVQACWRDTLQKHHEAAQEACLIHEGLTTIRAALSDISGIVNQQFERDQKAIAESSAETHREEAERSERTMHVLEVFIVTFYSVELAHLLGEAFEFGHTHFVGWSLITVAVLSFTMASILVTWERLSKRGTGATIFALFLMATLIHAGFMGANWWWKEYVDHGPSAKTSLPSEKEPETHSGDHP